MAISQRGNAMIYILVGIFLFAALAYTFVKSGKSGQGKLTNKQADVAAAEILGYAGTVSKSVDRLRQKGCSEQQISFENSLDALHTNPSAPSSHECDVFNPAGAALNPAQAQTGWFVGTLGAYNFFYTSGDAIKGSGTDCAAKSCADINLTLKDISKTLCDSLNKQLGQLTAFTPIPSDTLQACPFDGTFDCGGTATTLVFAASPLSSKPAACYDDTVTGYTFTAVLLAR